MVSKYKDLVRDGNVIYLPASRHRLPGIARDTTPTFPPPPRARGPTTGPKPAHASIYDIPPHGG
ncbi:MAG TPA: hypothetical protein V6D17_11335, partial [Candidatus Obscuribacterales bacterium]